MKIYKKLDDEKYVWYMSKAIQRYLNKVIFDEYVSELLLTRC